jgi:TRAP-type C4-dicarboxylate transport system permease small subunit
MKIMPKIEKGLSRSARYFAWLCGFLVLIQCVWLTHAVILRYFLRIGDMYVVEVTSLLLLQVAFLGAAFTLQEEALPAVFVIVRLLPGRVQQWLRVFTLVMGLIFFGFFTRGAIWIAVDAYKTDYVTTVVHWPYYPFWAVIALSGVLFLLVALSLLINTLKNIFQGSGHD